METQSKIHGDNGFRGFWFDLLLLTAACVISCREPESKPPYHVVSKAGNIILSDYVVTNDYEVRKVLGGDVVWWDNHRRCIEFPGTVKWLTVTNRFR